MRTPTSLRPWAVGVQPTRENGSVQWETTSFFCCTSNTKHSVKRELCEKISKYWKDGSGMQLAACWALKGTCGISEESLWMAHTKPGFSSSLPWSHEAEGHNTFLISKTYMKPLYTIYHKPTHTHWQTAHYIMTPQEGNHNTKPQLFSLRFLGLNQFTFEPGQDTVKGCI